MILKFDWILPWLFLAPYSTCGTQPGVRTLECVSRLAGEVSLVFVRGVLVLNVTMVQWVRVSTVHGETCWWRRNPDSNLGTRGVVWTNQVVTLLTLVVGNLSIGSAAKLSLAISDMLRRLTYDGFALGYGPGPGPVLSTQNHVSSLIL